jgi:hypothetical protein
MNMYLHVPVHLHVTVHGLGHEHGNILELEHEHKDECGHDQDPKN